MTLPGSRQHRVARIARTTGHGSAAPDEPATVLVAEDDDGVRRLAERILRHDGYQVVVAADGAEALALARQMRHLTLLISDVVMPGLSGVELAEHLRAEQPGIKLLLMSGMTGSALPPGYNGAFLSKPFRAAELSASVRELLSPAPAA